VRGWTGRLLTLAFLTACLLVTGCDRADPGLPGELVLAVASPNGHEGAAVLRLTGGDVETVDAANGRAFVDRAGHEIVVVVVLTAPGEIAVRLLLGSVGDLPDVEIVEVAAPDNTLRTDLSGYEVTFRRPSR
jgi:hypothetical protein